MLRLRYASTPLCFDSAQHDNPATLSVVEGLVTLSVVEELVTLSVVEGQFL